VPLLLVSRTGSARLETRTDGRRAVDLCRRLLLLLTRWSTAGSWSLNVVAWWESTRVPARAWLRRVLGYKEPRSGSSTRNKLEVRLRGPLEAQRVVGILRVAGCCQ
jgi:hypothetical protein